MPRETFILTQDIASGQLIDTHPKPGTNLQKLVDKKVIDTVMLLAVSASGISTRLDLLLIDQSIAVGPTGLGALTSKQHPLYINNTANGVISGGADVRGNLSSVAAIFDPVAMTLGLNTGTAATPANFGVGDIVRVQGQGLTGEFFAEVFSIVGPTLTFVEPGTVNPRLFIEGPTGVYSMERVRRWTMSWVDSLGSAFALSPGLYDIGVLRRAYLANIGETIGWVVVPVEAEAPQASGGGGGGSVDPRDIMRFSMIHNVLAGGA